MYLKSESSEHSQFIDYFTQQTVRKNKRTYVRTNERTTDRPTERTNEQTNKRTNERTNKQTNKRTNKQTNERTNEQTNQHEHVRMNFKTQPKMRLSLPSIKCSAAPPSFRLLPSTVRCLNCAQLFDNRALGRICSDERLTLETSASDSLYGGQFTLSTQLTKPNYFIDGCEKRICEFRVHILLKGAVKGPVSPS